MRKEDVRRIAGEVVDHLLASQFDLDEETTLSQAEEELAHEGARLLWEAAHNPEFDDAKSFTVRRDEDGKVVLVVNR